MNTTASTHPPTEESPTLPQRYGNILSPPLDSAETNTEATCERQKCVRNVSEMVKKKKKVKLTCLFHVYLFKVVVGAEVSLSKLEAQLNGWSFPLVSLRVRHRGTCSFSNDALYSQFKKNLEILQAADQFIDLFWGLYVYLHVCPFV